MMFLLRDAGCCIHHLIFYLVMSSARSLPDLDIQQITLMYINNLKFDDVHLSHKSQGTFTTHKRRRTGPVPFPEGGENSRRDWGWRDRE